MGSQTLEILRQGVWASLTGGWFYDPHQGVFCNVVHLYLWLFLVCTPFVAYLYFPVTWITWLVYCIVTSFTIVVVKLANMALHRLYDKAQTMSEANLKNQFFKITKETVARDEENGIELKVLGNDGSRNSVEQAINEASEENSMMSMENINSIIDLKVDVHRKNSSESIEFMFYEPSMMSANNSQHDQHSIVGSASVTKSIRSSSNAATALNANTQNAATSSKHDTINSNKYLTVYPEHEGEIPKITGHSSAGSNSSASSGTAAVAVSAAGAAAPSRQSQLLRKLSDDFKRRHQRRRLERQSSLDAAAESLIVSRLMQQHSLDNGGNTNSFLHPQSGQLGKSLSTSKVNALMVNSAAASNSSNSPNTLSSQGNKTMSSAQNNTGSINSGAILKTTRLQRHRSSETHEERQRHKNRGRFLPIHHEHHVVGATGGSDAGILDADDMEMGLASSSSRGNVENRVRALQSWILGSYSDVYIEDDSYTKSDLGIEKLDDRAGSHQRGVANGSILRSHKATQDSNSSMPALQLPAVTGSNRTTCSNHANSSNMKRRRHSTSLFKRGTADSQHHCSSANAHITAQQPPVRRIKSAALEISCPQPSVSNLSPHPNSVEAISGQQQIKNPASALLPPPSKCLVRNPHLNLCPKFGGSFGGSTATSMGGSGSSLNMSEGVSNSATALLDAVYPSIEEQEADEKCVNAIARSSTDLEISENEAEVERENILETETDEVEHINSAEQQIDDDLVDDVPFCNRALDCEHHSAESDSNDNLQDEVDNDEFINFDDNLDHILNDLQQTQQQLDHDLKTQAEYAQQNSLSSEMPCTSNQALRQRLHSTDSETETNNAGSRSPLLSGGNKQRSFKRISLKKQDIVNDNEKALAKNMVSLQRQPLSNFAQQVATVKGEGDSGCPSSDCEQISASSKDMLLAAMAAAENEVAETCVGDHAEDVEKSAALSKTADSQESKSLGAIPKAVKYREIDETKQSIRKREVSSAGAVGSTQLHKRKGNSSERSFVKAASRTSSSNSSYSISNDSVSAEMPKMVWIVQGCERGRSINGITTDGSSIPAVHIPETMQALSPSYAVDPSGESLSNSERIYYREKGRRSSKLNTEAASGFGDYESGSGVVPSRPSLGVVLAASSSSSANSNCLNSQNTSLALRSLIINEERNSQSFPLVPFPAARSGSQALMLANAAAVAGSSSVSHNLSGNSAAAATAAAILNVEGHLENYCDYWRPPCMLSTTEKPAAPKSFYKYRFKCLGLEHEFKISMDRLELLALFDRDLHWFHIVLSFMLSILVAYLGSTILQLGYYKDLFAFLFCAVIAGSQYSLLKSVQPDAASPIHGFNKIVAYSRAIYFSLAAGMLLFLEKLSREYQTAQDDKMLHFFGLEFSAHHVINTSLQIMYVFLLCLPLVFSLGLFPQINTFLMYLLEQVDMHVFGGNAAGSLLGALLCVIRSIMGVMLLYGPLFAALTESQSTQYIVFSIFCAMLIPLGYHLSRSASDFSHLWALIKHCILSTYREDDDELSGSNTLSGGSRKLTTSTPKRGVKSGKVAAEKTEASTEQAAAALDSNENIEMSCLDKTPAGSEEHTQTNLERKNSKSKASSLGSSSQTLEGTLKQAKRVVTASNSLSSLAVVAESPRSCAEKNGHDDEVAAAATLEIPLEHEELQNKAETDLEAEENDKGSTCSTTNPGDMSTLTANGASANLDDIQVDSQVASNEETESSDPLPKKLQNTVNTRLKNDVVVTAILALIVLGLHCSTVFTVLQPDLNIVLYGFSGALGALLHYVIPQMRKHMPWLCFARPILRQKEYGQFEVSNAPQIMWFEKVYIYLCMLERNVMFPLMVISALTADSQTVAAKYGVAWGTLIMVVCSLKFIRNAYSDATNQYLIVIFTVLFFQVDFIAASETFLLDYFFVSIAFRKCCDFLLKLQFIVTYIAPWQITWGSAFHAFAQPFSVPHSAMLFLQAGVSALLSTPLNPFLGSAIFLTSYVRPIKFWERDYNTRRIDHSNTRLSSQLERDLGADDNNLNSIFYEHLTRSLQHSLCGDLLMGRWGNVNQGDCFVLASDYLNCLVHIIELGNGLCTFQMRGLEFRGTYCQQREVEAITEDVEDNDGCCCCDPGHLPRMLSANAMFSTRWLAWQVVAAQYVLEGYSISDNLASATLQVFEYRKVLITYYIKSIIYYVIKNPKLEQWLASSAIQDALQHTLSRQFVDLDPIFNYNLDEDFDFRAVGITRSSFCYVYLNWINFCYDKRKESQQQQQQQQQQQTQQYYASNVPVSNNMCASQSNNNNNNSTLIQQQQQTAASYNDSKSTPNLCGSQIKSQSQQQLRSRPQKSATMSGSTSVTNNHSSSEQIASSQSFANISRQTSESAPGLSGTNSKLNLGGQLRSKNAPAKPARLKEDSPSESQHRPSQNITIKLRVQSVSKDSPIVSLCLALGLLARRSLATASHSSLTGVEFFLHGLHALFKGDFRITSPRDEWVFADMELLHGVVAPAVKMALKLQQDHISNADEFLDPTALYESIDTCSKDLVISHEADPVWRSAVLRGAPNLLALRHVMEDGSDEYRIIRLTKRFLSFRVIKLNRECVRGLWAGQQQELIYLRNRNPERGSIQNAKQALRNIINSSCDQPIGYPIYVSPLTTSYADTNEQLKEVIGGPITLESIRLNVLNWWHRIRERCRQGCSSGSAMETSHLGLMGSSQAGVGVVGFMGSVSAASTVAGGSSMDPNAEQAGLYISPPLYNTLQVSNYFNSSSANAATTISNRGSLNAPYVRSSDSLQPLRIRPNDLIAGKSSSTARLGVQKYAHRSGDVSAEAREAVLRDLIRRTHTPSGVLIRSSAERERRATLPVTSSVPVGDALRECSQDSPSQEEQEAETADINNLMGAAAISSNNSPRFAKNSNSSVSLGLGCIITDPGEYPRKSKGPLCLNVESLGGSKSSDANKQYRRLPIDLYKKVIIVDGNEIYDSLDILDFGEDCAVIWPNEQMRKRGGRAAWKDWKPRAGMVGFVVHFWVPNHVDPRYNTSLSRIIYLLEIGSYYVPVGEYGLREYNQIVDSYEDLGAGSSSSRRSSLQMEIEELRRRQLPPEGLTPILGSSLESPTSQLAAASSEYAAANENISTAAAAGNKTKLRDIKAVSSSSSEDELGLVNLELRNRKMLLNMLKMIADKKKSSPEPEQQNSTAEELEDEESEEVKQTASETKDEPETQEVVIDLNEAVISLEVDDITDEEDIWQKRKEVDKEQQEAETEKKIEAEKNSENKLHEDDDEDDDKEDHDKNYTSEV